jgi:hypothetical protein
LLKQPVSLSARLSLGRHSDLRPSLDGPTSAHHFA